MSEKLKTENFTLEKVGKTIIFIQQEKPLTDKEDFILRIESIPAFKIKAGEWLELDDYELVLNCDIELVDEEQRNLEAVHQLEDERNILFDKLSESIKEIEHILYYEL